MELAGIVGLEGGGVNEMLLGLIGAKSGEDDVGMTAADGIDSWATAVAGIAGGAG